MGKFTGGKDDNDLKGVVDTASALNVSEFEVFCLAYQNWFGHTADMGEIDAVFGRYMDTTMAPMWVRDFTRRVQEMREENQLDAAAFNIEAPPPTTYWTAFLGGMAFASMIMIIALLVYLVLHAEDAAMVGCQFPPCY